MGIKQACLVIADLEDGTTAMTVSFDGGFDGNSSAHGSLRKILQMLDDMGMAIVEPIKVSDTPVGVPTPMLVDSSGHTIIPS